MKTQQVIVLGVLIIVACLLSLFQFSNLEGMDGADESSVKDGSNNSPSVIKTNAELIQILNGKLSSPPDPEKDKATIRELQGSISSLTTKNAATLLGELGNPNNVNNPRAFLKYMNWFASNCPIDSDLAPGCNNIL